MRVVRSHKNKVRRANLNEVNRGIPFAGDEPPAVVAVEVPQIEIEVSVEQPKGIWARFRQWLCRWLCGCE